MKKMSGEKKTIIFSSVKLSENKISRETFLLKKSIFMCETKFQHFFSSFLCVQNRKKTLEKNDLKISFRQIFYLYVKKMFRTNILLGKTQILPTFLSKTNCPKTNSTVFTHGGKNLEKNSPELFRFFKWLQTKKTNSPRFLFHLVSHMEKYYPKHFFPDISFRFTRQRKSIPFPRCTCVTFTCVSPAEAGSAGSGRSWISHILTLPSSEHDMSSLKHRETRKSQQLLLCVVIRTQMWSVHFSCVWEYFHN